MAAAEPVMTVDDGDIIVTACVDAYGRDAENRQVTPRGNPMSGPFAVRGAEAGDTLAVQIRRIEPTRRVGISSAMLSPNVVDPDYVPHLPWVAPGVRSEAEWDVDVEQGSARLVSAGGGVFDLTLPIDPMIGCFGVAPADGEAISTATSAQHGGNMDYRGCVAGVTVYFPVFVPGACFYLGDVHARQGDGEMCGTGIEISAEVEFRLNVIQGWRNQWPRGENGTHIFTVGNARPLDQAVQHATTEMSRWLTEGYGLDKAFAHALMGQVVEYELGNMYDPAYTFVCKLARRWLRAAGIDSVYEAGER
jgi:acetamidase/formamidase